MPDSIYLHKDDKYNTLGWYHAEDENTILSEHDYDESVMEDYVEYTPVYRLEEAVMEVTKKLGWHSVDESLPPMDEEVIVLTDFTNGRHAKDSHRISFGHIVNPENAYAFSRGGWNIPGVTHWMSCPILKEDK